MATVFQIMGKCLLGLDALIKKIDRVISMHLNKVWVPGELEKFDKQKTETQAKLITLGKSPSVLNLNDFFTHTHNLLSTKLFTPPQIDKICSDEIATLNLPKDTQFPTVFEAMVYQKALILAAEECIASATFIEKIKNSFILEVKKVLEADNTGENQLCRFPTLQLTLITNIQSQFATGLPHFRLKMKERLGILENSPSSDKKGTELQQALIQCLMAEIFVPLLHVTETTKKLYPFVYEALKNMETVPPESTQYATNRSIWERKLSNIEHVEQTLKSLSKGDD